MARSNRLFKRAYNQALDLIVTGGNSASLSGFARDLGVSRTTARMVHNRLILSNLISPNSSSHMRLRLPTEHDYYSEAEIRPAALEIELKFMNWILHDRVSPGTKMSEAALGRRFGVSASTVRELLIRLSRLGFIHKDANRHWILDGFSRDYANEVMEFRQVFELRAVKRVLGLSDDHLVWEQLRDCAQKHMALEKNLKRDFLEMPAMDVQFHSIFSQASGARLLPAFNEAISLIYHYHYHHFWDEASRYKRAQAAIADHLGIIEAVLRRDQPLALSLMHEHLTNAQAALEDTFGSD